MQAAHIRPMPVSSLERVVIEGPAGAIEAELNDPGPARRGYALVAHPNPVQGGTKDNKVVTTLAKVFYNLGYLAARPNFRGVGASAGAHDEGLGETEDLLVVAAWLAQRYGNMPLVLAGFSFGGFVQTRVAKRIAAQRLVLVGPAVSRFPTEGVAPDTLVVHGEKDEIVPLQAVFDWARPQHLPIVVVPGCGHFFHGQLGLLAQIVARALR